VQITAGKMSLPAYIYHDTRKKALKINTDVYFHLSSTTPNLLALIFTFQICPFAIFAATFIKVKADIWISFIF
jgi:hypothetical protein